MTTTMKHSTFQLHITINLRANKSDRERKDFNKSVAKLRAYVPAVPYFEGSFKEFKKHYGVIEHLEN